MTMMMMMTHAFNKKSHARMSGGMSTAVSGRAWDEDHRRRMARVAELQVRQGKQAGDTGGEGGTDEEGHEDDEEEDEEDEDDDDGAGSGMSTLYEMLLLLCFLLLGFWSGFWLFLGCV